MDSPVLHLPQEARTVALPWWTTGIDVARLGIGGVEDLSVLAWFELRDVMTLTQMRSFLAVRRRF